MPELPEVETIVRDLRAQLSGQTITDVQVSWPGAIYNLSPEQFRQQLVGRQLVEIKRRGKYLVFVLDGGLYLLIHLRMTGQLLLDPSPSQEKKHIHLGFVLGERLLCFRDTRKFGRVYLTHDPDTVLGQLGPEPLLDEFDHDTLASLLRRRKGMLKPLLLDQRFVAGLGNIYADEALFVAGIHPCRRVGTLQPPEVARLHAAIRQVLQQGIANRGTSLDNYRDPQGESGTNQGSLGVFRRTAAPCPRCGTPIQRILVGGRSTHFCPKCQK